MACQRCSVAQTLQCGIHKASVAQIVETHLGIGQWGNQQRNLSAFLLLLLLLTAIVVVVVVVNVVVVVEWMSFAIGFVKAPVGFLTRSSTINDLHALSASFLGIGGPARCTELSSWCFCWFGAIVAAAAATARRVQLNIAVWVHPTAQGFRGFPVPVFQSAVNFSWNEFVIVSPHQVGSQGIGWVPLTTKDRITFALGAGQPQPAIVHGWWWWWRRRN